MTILPTATVEKHDSDTNSAGSNVTPTRTPNPSSFHSFSSSPSDEDDEFHDTMAPPEYTPSEAADSAVADLPPPPPLEEESVSDTNLELEELERAVESLPSSDAGSVAESASVAAGSPPPSVPSALAPAAVNTSGIQIDGPDPNQGPWQLEDWLRVSGQSLGVATTATSTGFNLARGATAISLTIAKRLAQVAVALPAMAIDSVNGTVPGDRSGATASALAHQSVGGLFDLISTLALGGIDLGSALTTAGLGAATTGVEGIRRTLGSEVVKSLGQFVKLVQREWNADNDSLPPGGLPPFGLTGVTRALTAWICIQMVTHKEYEKKMLKELEEFDIDALREEIEREHKEDRKHGVGGLSTVTITSENTEKEGDVIGAEVGQRQGPQQRRAIEAPPNSTAQAAAPLSEKEAMKGLMRYSSLVLAVYGGVALAWLGSLPKDEMQDGTPSQVATTTPLPADGLTREQDEEQFLLAASMMDLTEQERDEAEAEATSQKLTGRGQSQRRMPGFLHGDGDSPGEVLFSAEPEEGGEGTVVPSNSNSSGSAIAPGTPAGRANASSATTTSSSATGIRPTQTASTYSYLNLISGQHDEELFHRVGNLARENVQAGSYDEYPHHHVPAPPAREGVARPSQPRYYIVTDHSAQKVILVLRGSLTLGDIATDLTCESREFYFPDPESRAGTQKSTFSVPFPADEASTSTRQSEETETETPLVHEGMYETALAVGSPHRPVHRAVRLALESQPGYNLDIAGHSLGAGVASLLAILWANPETTQTTIASGLPINRTVHAYCYACPCTMSSSLSRRCASLITTYAYSYDLVCRLSLGSIQDIRNASAWILWEDRQQQQQQHSSSSSGAFSTRVPKLLTKAFEHQSGRMDADLESKQALEQDFLALRRTLEANMTNVELYPPGQVLYLFHPTDLSTSTSDNTTTNKTRAFTLKKSPNGTGSVGKVENTFGQIIFSRRLLSCHMPSVYDKALRGVDRQ